MARGKNARWAWVSVTFVVLVTHGHVTDIVSRCVALRIIATRCQCHVFTQYVESLLQHRGKGCVTTCAHWSTLISASKEASAWVPANCYDKIIRSTTLHVQSGLCEVRSCMSLIQTDSAWYETLAGGCCPYPWHMYCMTRRVKSMFRIKNWTCVTSTHICHARSESKKFIHFIAAHCLVNSLILRGGEMEFIIIQAFAVWRFNEHLLSSS